MEWLIIALLIFVQQPAKNPKGKGATKSNSAQEANQITGKDQQTPAPPTVLSAPAPNPQIRKSDDAREENVTIQRKLVWFTGMLAIVGILQFAVMFLQLLVYRRQAHEMRRQRHEMVRQRTELSGQRAAMENQLETMRTQLQMMENSGKQTDQLIEQARTQAAELHGATEAAIANAHASLANWEALKNSERPWLFINIQTSDAKKDENGTFQSLGFTVSFRNWGKTPAEIINFDQHPECRDDCANLPMPPKYQLEGHVQVHTRMVPAGETWRDIGESYFYATSFLMQDQWKDIQSSRKRFVYWGRLQYRDLIEHPKTIHELKDLGTVHETCFCYFWSPALNRFLICGPWGYNKHT